MGISDDIVPRRVPRMHRAAPRYITDIEPKNTQNKESESPDDFAESDRPEADLFFRSQPAKESKKTDPKPKEPKSQSEESEKNGSLSKVLFTLFFWLFLLAIVFGIAYKNLPQIKNIFLKNGFTVGNSSTSKSSQSSTYVSDIKPQDYTSGTSSVSSTNTSSSQTSLSSSSTSPTIADTTKSSIKIQVLNGNGITNSASTIKKQLQTAGFTVSSLTNASNFNYASSIIYYKSTKKAEADLVNATLKLAATSLQASDTIAKTYDIVVVVGKN